VVSVHIVCLFDPILPSRLWWPSHICRRSFVCTRCRLFDDAGIDLYDKAVRKRGGI